jgi:hypothetical protein
MGYESVKRLHDDEDDIAGMEIKYLCVCAFQQSSFSGRDWQIHGD